MTVLSARKIFAPLFLIIFSLAFLAMPCQIQAAEGVSARQALENSVNRILDCIKNPDYANPTTRGPLRQRIEDEVLHIFDFGEFSSRTVGARWRTFSPAQQKAFSDAFADLLLNTYVNKIDGYNGEQIAYLGERSDASGKVEIRTEVTMKGGKKVPVAYRMLHKGSNWRVYDVLIENLSLVMNYRTQFQDILKNGSPEELAARIRAKTEEVRSKNGK